MQAFKESPFGFQGGKFFHGAYLSSVLKMGYTSCTNIGCVPTIKIMHRDFEAHFRNIFGDSYNKFVKAIESSPSTAIRLNEEKEAALSFEGLKPIPWAENAFWLERRPAFYADPLHFSGAYYVQDPSSMFFTNGIDFSKVQTALDLCAAPGGKSTHLLSKLSPEALLVSNELDMQRNKVLVENLNRWGRVNSVVTNGRSSAFAGLKEVFDLVLLDAPCSGEGMFRKDQKSLDQWSPNLVESCALIQSELIEDAARLVKPGGYLVYSTCTFEKAENEDRVAQVAEDYGFEPCRIPVPNGANIVEKEVLIGNQMYPSYHLFFHELEGEGQFVCVMRKAANESTQPKLRIKNNKLQELKPVEIARVKAFIDVPEGISLMLYNDMVYGIPSQHMDLQRWLMSSMPLWKLGIKMGQFAGKDFKPHHELALSTLAAGFSRRVEVGYNQAIAYLKREPLVLGAEEPKGWILITYKGLGLGWVKNLGNRVNNYLPKELTLRKDIKKAEF